MANRLTRLAFAYIDENHSDDKQITKQYIVKAFRAGYAQCLVDNPKPKPKSFNRPTDKLIKDMKMLYGIPPYDGCSNLTMGDGYFPNDLKRRVVKAGCDWEKVLEEARKQGRQTPASWDK